MTDELDPGVELYPSWRQALVRFHEAEFKDGDVITHGWLYEVFEVEALAAPSKISADQYQTLKLKLLSQFTSFRQALLEQHQIMLRADHGHGYVIVTPREQTRRAYEDRMANIQREYRAMYKEVIHVREATLTAEERRDRTEYLAQVGLLRQLLKPPRELPPPDD